MSLDTASTIEREVEKESLSRYNAPNNGKAEEAQIVDLKAEDTPRDIQGLRVTIPTRT